MPDDVKWKELMLAETARVATQTISELNARCYRLEKTTSQLILAKDNRLTLTESQSNQQKHAKRNAKSLHRQQVVKFIEEILHLRIAMRELEFEL